MTMRKRSGGTILDRAGYDPELDPNDLCKPMGKPPAPAICHCLPPQKNQLGGMTPVIDREAAQVVCKVCRKQIGPACRRRHVQHLRGLIALDSEAPRDD